MAYVDDPDAVDALQQIVETMGITSWEFNATSCNVGSVKIAPPAQPDQKAESKVSCDCSFSNGTCHVVGMYVFLFSLCFPGEGMKIVALMSGKQFIFVDSCF